MITACKADLDTVAVHAGGDRRELNQHGARGIQIRRGGGAAELAVLAATQYLDGAQCRIVDFRSLVKAEDQLARSNVENIAVVEQLPVVALDSRQLRNASQQTPILQGLQQQFAFAHDRLTTP